MILCWVGGGRRGGGGWECDFLSCGHAPHAFQATFPIPTPPPYPSPVCLGTFWLWPSLPISSYHPVTIDSPSQPSPSPFYPTFFPLPIAIGDISSHVPRPDLPLCTLTCVSSALPALPPPPYCCVQILPRCPHNLLLPAVLPCHCVFSCT